MEKQEQNIYEKHYAMEIEDPYELAMEFVNYMHSFGEINVTKNIMSTNGPRKQADLHFHLIRKFDRFSRLFFMFKMHADITQKRLSITALAMNQLQIPIGDEPGGVFQEWYMKEIQPDIYKKASRAIKEITKNFEKYLADASSPIAE
ncbi:MAG: hypothetical protein HZB65_00135 [Candidatus Aenigmarchaeota archaeon]|nr:hypothetical protein [Candidatus Aenigmarchaeota archaeon]